MIWNRSIAIGLAKASCNFCHGYGMRPRHHMEQEVCGCVCREIFRICHRRFLTAASSTHAETCTWDHTGGPRGYRVYSRRRAEYIADFHLVARRTLEADQFALFRLHFELGADWHLCCRQLGMIRGDFYHAVYVIEERLGRVYAELKPYALYPPAEYFAVHVPTARPEEEISIAPPVKRLRDMRVQVLAA